MSSSAVSCRQLSLVAVIARCCVTPNEVEKSINGDSDSDSDDNGQRTNNEQRTLPPPARTNFAGVADDKCNYTS
jgi:hypothetical protein